MATTVAAGVAAVQLGCMETSHGAVILHPWNARYTSGSISSRGVVGVGEWQRCGMHPYGCLMLFVHRTLRKQQQPQQQGAASSRGVSVLPSAPVPAWALGADFRLLVIALLFTRFFGQALVYFGWCSCTLCMAGAWHWQWKNRRCWFSIRVGI